MQTRMSNILKTVVLAMFCMIFTTNIMAQSTADSAFVTSSRPVIFSIDKTRVTREYQNWLCDSLRPILESLGEDGIILGRSAASPEGPLRNNHRLAVGRRDAAVAVLENCGFDASKIKFDVVDEDYEMLVTLMEMRHDKDAERVKALYEKHGTDFVTMKKKLKAMDGGRLWRRLFREYYSELRAVRIVVYDKANDRKIMIEGAPKIEIKSATDITIESEHKVDSADFDLSKITTVPEMKQWKEPRRERWAIKTNLLFDFAYMPSGYNRFCPIPNVALEYYPTHGHFTYGASFDGPWWQDYDDQKYFQVRQYQLETRYYLRSGDIRKNPPGKGAAFRGWYLQAYANAGLYCIMFSPHRGWIGEAYGGGIGGGYVMPLTKDGHWKLEFNLQAGYLWTKYDPFQYECPVDPTENDDLYYYKWEMSPDLFKARQYRFSWLGPTRVGITLSYDILYRKNKSKGKNHGVSFNKWERGYTW